MQLFLGMFVECQVIKTGSSSKQSIIPRHGEDDASRSTAYCIQLYLQARACTNQERYFAERINDLFISVRVDSSYSYV